MNNGKTRLKMTLLMISLALVEGLIRSVLKDFPLAEVFSVQTMVFGGYVAVKTVSNMNEAKNETARLVSNNGNTK